jgi:hypothetical protein
MLVMCEAPTVLVALVLSMAAVLAACSACTVMGLQGHSVSAAGSTSPPRARPPPDPDSASCRLWFHRIFPSQKCLHSKPKFYPDGSFKCTSSRVCLLHHPVISFLHRASHVLRQVTVSALSLLVIFPLRITRNAVQLVPRVTLVASLLLHCTSFCSASAPGSPSDVTLSVRSFLYQTASAQDWWVIWSSLWALGGLLAVIISFSRVLLLCRSFWCPNNVQISGIWCITGYYILWWLSSHRALIDTARLTPVWSLLLLPTLPFYWILLYRGCLLLRHWCSWFAVKTLGYRSSPIVSTIPCGYAGTWILPPRRRRRRGESGPRSPRLAHSPYLPSIPVMLLACVSWLVGRL